jgi:dolichol-phosphate mannosyltransferase
MLSNKLVTIIIPAFDEIENLEVLFPIIANVQAELEGFEFENLVILPTFAKEADKQKIVNLGGLPLIRHPTNSFGDAIRTGIINTKSTSVYTIFMDADGSNDPESIRKLLESDSDFQVVVASRYVSGGSSDNPLLLKIMSRLLNKIYSTVLGIKIKDLSTNFKRYLSEDLKTVELKCNNFDVVEELLFKVSKLHGDLFESLEVPDHFYERKFGVTKRRLGPYIVSYVISLILLRTNLREKISHWLT